ncbi:homocysteine S-methyltransferase family protein [Serpentinicella alkaliphila]|uniref:Methionine synthase n=1 Tax=Serpentinicella alkaliphila TaxID=1734049 RepID=A0A4R2TMY5_9FIRM|nr:homocysteine S-methyltransferase family protein [Serpentinicella alkaliphila]QUH24624.1 homocysteine S-methyltransferase family protein [Serpentinicella alkaliphila]TCQ02625.1 5-methyltetrahydrofolate--homocysteine methyltransferase [Serpentinicella alkaliphila]
MVKRQKLYDLLNEKILVFDGAMGTMLQKNGLTTGCPEEFNLDKRKVIKRIHKEYVNAGCNIIQTNTFGANRIKLAEYNLQSKVEEINRAAVKLVKEMAGEEVLVAGDIGPTGKLMYPVGDLSFDEAYEVFYEQAKVLIESGVNIINIETISDIQEARAAIIAVKDAGDVPIICTLTFNTEMRTLTGSDPETVATVLEALGVDILGVNCGFGPDMMIDIVRRMSSVTDKYIIAQPNAGLPKYIDGITYYDLTPEKMASYVEDLINAGANIIGGCCGTTPEHMKIIKDKVKNLRPIVKEEKQFTKLASVTKTLIITEELPTRVIGECINPTAKKYLAQAIKDNNLSLLCEEAIKQVESNANIIDVNVGVNLTEESSVMRNAVYEIQRVIDAPLSIDTVNFEAMEEGLKACAGKPLINSTNGEERHLDKVLRLAKRYGAAILGLTLDEKGIPKKAEERFVIAERIVNRALEYGLKRQDIFIDTLVLTAGAQQQYALETIKAIQLVKKELGVKTVLGISNISHGLPNRAILNSTFLGMALNAGLDMPIMNPYIDKMWEVIKSADVLTGKDLNAKIFVESFNDEKVVEKTIEVNEVKIIDKLTKAIVSGDKNSVPLFIDELKANGFRALDLVNNCIIPALEDVGNKYEKQIYFLPQLLLSAEAAQKAFNELKEELNRSTVSNVGTIVLATVKGDIHDIGKNIVSIMLQNHGFKVIDLGKDVDSDRIIECALKEEADIIGLSALMTTTMNEMKIVTESLKSKGLSIPVLIGGAVVTEEYANTIGAFYSSDAIGAVKQAKLIINK